MEGWNHEAWTNTKSSSVGMSLKMSRFRSPAKDANGSLLSNNTDIIPRNTYVSCGGHEVLVGRVRSSYSTSKAMS
jgi:hypothetical protein